MIPDQLQKEEFRFIKIRKQQKRPFEKSWQKDNNYQHDNKLIQSHIKLGGNYGVLTGKGNLIVIDFDIKKYQDKMIPLLPKTFSVKTGSGLLHYYYIIDDPKSFKIFDEEKNTILDFQGIGKQVVGAGSKHPNGTYYKVFNDLPINTITLKECEQIFTKTTPEQEKKREEKENTPKNDNLSINNELDKYNISDYDLSIKSGTNMECPFCNEKKGFSVSDDKKLYNCFGCDEKGNLTQYVAKKENITTKEAYKKLLKHFNIKKDYEKGKEEIKLPGEGKLISEFAHEIGIIASKQKDIFIKIDSNKVVKIDSLKQEEEKERIGFKDVKPSQLISYIEKHAIPGIYKNVSKKGEAAEYIFVKKSFSKGVSEISLESEQFRDKLPIIKTIYTVPIPILKDGILTFPKKGYDKRFNSWLDYNSPSIEEDINFEEAKKIILNLYSEFCFKEEKDKTHAIAGLITPFLRGLYPDYYSRTPLFLYEANRERSGKDYCAGITGIVYEDDAKEEPAISTEDNKKTASGEELRKKLLSSLRQGRKRLHFANNKGYVSNAILEGFITAKRWSDRLLGKNEEAEFGNDLELSMSANVGLGYTSDLLYRMRKITLFLDIEDPNKRKFEKPDLHGYVRENRSKILGSIYSLIKNWIEKNKPNGNTAFSSFPEWAKICGGVMVNAGFGDPCLQEKAPIIGGDTTTHDFKTLFNIMYEKYSDKFISKQELMIVVNDIKEDYEIFTNIDILERKGKIVFGKLLTKMYGRIFDNIKLIADITSNRSARHRLKFTKNGNVGNVGIENQPVLYNEENKKIPHTKDIENITNITNITTSNKKRILSSKTLNNFFYNKEKKGINTLDFDLFIEELKAEFEFIQYETYLNKFKKNGEISIIGNKIHLFSNFVFDNRVGDL